MAGIVPTNNQVLNHPIPQRNSLSSDLDDLDSRKLWYHLGDVHACSGSVAIFDEEGAKRVWYTLRTNCRNLFINAYKHNTCVPDRACVHDDHRVCCPGAWDHAYSGEPCNSPECRCKLVRLCMEHALLCMDANCLFCRSSGDGIRIKDRLIRTVINDMVLELRIPFADAMFRLITASAMDHNRCHRAAASSCADTHESFDDDDE